MTKKQGAILQVENLAKAFYGNTVLNSISFEMQYGEVLGLIGQNGAGKSTLVKILTGAYTKDSGTIKIEGEEKDLSSIDAANAAGIALVFQELSLALNMTVADNIFVRDWPKNKTGLVSKRELYKKTKQLIDEFKVDIRPDDKISNLTIGKRQIVEILKAVSKNPKVLILDEPTSSLEEGEINVLFSFIQQLKDKGFSIIYISHHMSEIFEIVDNLLVLRDGNKVLECPKEEIDVQSLISVMIGRAYENYTGSSEARKLNEQIMYKVKSMTLRPYFHDVNFAIKKGEILGVSGIIGCGKTELCETLFGIRKPQSGDVEINGKKMNFSSPADSKKSGLLCVPENRKTQGLFLNDSVRSNMITCILGRVQKGIFLNKKKIDTVLEKYGEELKIKMTSDKQIIRFLSGGNQQKVLVAKCIADNPSVLIAMDPTRGIDVPAKADIHRILHELSEEGLSILVISSEIDELMTLCDRILVMNGGEISDEFNRENFNETDILMCMHKKGREGA